jgi:hypothetical protein
METAFKDMGYKVQTRELSYFHDDYGLEAGGDEDEDEDDEDDLEDDGTEESYDDASEGH